MFPARARSLTLPACVLATFAAACGSTKEIPAPELTQPTALVIVSGDAQVGDVGAALAQPLVARVTDVKGRAISGVTVGFTAVGGGSVSPASAVSGNDGSVSTTWTLAQTPGYQSVVAQASGRDGTQSARAVFTASNGGTISGGVTVQSALPISFGALRGGSGAATLSRASRSVVPSRSAQRTATARGSLRRLIVHFRPVAGMMRLTGAAPSRSSVDASARAMHRTLAVHAARLARTELSPMLLAARVTLSAGESLDSAAAALRADANVESVEEDEIVPMLAPWVAAALDRPAAGAAWSSASSHTLGGALSGVLPNDLGLAQQFWNYNMLDLPRAWGKTTGSASVLVAVVDNGVRYDHPSVSANLTHDGYNFVTGGARLDAPEPVCQGGTTQLEEAGPGPDPTQPDDLEWDAFVGCWSRSTIGDHGLHVSGTIGAAANDGEPLVGVNWKVSIRPVRVLDITGSGSYFDVAQGVLYAAGLPASDGNGGTVQAPSRAAVINMSLGGPANSLTLANAIAAATDAGSLIVASAGNDVSSDPSYPAAYPQVLAVAALGPDLQLATYSNIGASVSLSAPGGDFRSYGATSGILSTTWDYVNQEPSFAWYSGTSMAAPHVTGVAALVLAGNPGLTNTELRARLQNTAIHLGGPGRDDRYGYGIVNGYNAVVGSSPARATWVRVLDATTGAVVKSAKVRNDGSYAITGLSAGSYYLVAGEDDSGDGIIGVPRRRFGWYGPAGGPAPITLTAGQSASASLTIGTPLESKPHTTIQTANRLVVNGYMAGHITYTDGPGVYSIRIPTAGTYYFEAGGLLGSCRFGVELDTYLELLDATGTAIATNDNTVLPGSLYCSLISAQLQPGTYYLRVTPAGGSTGQYRVWARDVP